MPSERCVFMRWIQALSTLEYVSINGAILVIGCHISYLLLYFSKTVAKNVTREYVSLFLKDHGKDNNCLFSDYTKLLSPMDTIMVCRVQWDQKIRL